MQLTQNDFSDRKKWWESYLSVVYNLWKLQPRILFQFLIDFLNWGFCRNYGHADYSSTRNCCARRPCKQLIDYLTEVHQRRKHHRCKFWTDDFWNRFSCYWAFCSEVRLTLWPSAFRLLLWRFIYTSTNLCLVFISVRDFSEYVYLSSFKNDDKHSRVIQWLF